MSNPLFNSNDYNRGFDDGKNDGYAGDDKNYRRMGRSWKYAIHGNHSLNTYTEGYNQGYLVGKMLKATEKTPVNVQNETKQNISSKNTINYSSMQRGIDGQIDLLQQMRAYLQQLQDQFDAINRTYQHFLNGLDAEGIDIKLLQRFEEYFEENKGVLNSLSSKIDSDDIPYTEQVIRHLEETPR
jgi:hypothetical protein